MPLSVTSFFKRLIVSGMEYALLIRTMASSLAALAAPDGNNISAHVNRATEQMLRINMDLLLVVPCERLSGVGVGVPRNSEPWRARRDDQGDRSPLKVAGLWT